MCISVTWNLIATHAVKNLLKKKKTNKNCEKANNYNPLKAIILK